MDNIDIEVPKVDREEEPHNENEEPEEEEKQPEPEEPDEREEEAHEEYVPSDNEKLSDATPLYDPNDELTLQVNSKNKARTIKKIILESLNLSKKANVILLKKDKNESPEGCQDPAEFKWKNFSERDYDMQAKFLHGTTIGFKVYMEIHVGIEGRGQSYKTQLTIDP